MEINHYIRQVAEYQLKQIEYQASQLQRLKDLTHPYASISSLLPSPLPPPVSSLLTMSAAAAIRPNRLSLPTQLISSSPMLLPSAQNISPYPQSVLLSGHATPAICPPDLCNLLPRKLFTCSHPGCGKALKTRHGLERHSRNHNGGRRFACTVKGCEKKFLESTTLKRHLRVHTGEKPFLCSSEGCGRSFSDGSNFRRHVLTHSKEKPFKCPCAGCPVRPEGFTRAASLKTHLLHFHKVVPV